MASKEYWFDLADYDLVIAEAMLSTKRFLYVSFICHQVIEKALKGYWVLKRNANPLYTHNLHNLLLLAEKSDIANCMNDSQLDLLDFL